MFLVSSCSCRCPVHWSQVLSREWRRSWSSANRRCSGYIWVISLPTNVRHKLQRVNKILKQSIRLAKKLYYVSRFESIKDDARKMWENIRMVLNNTKKSTPSPLHFFVDNKIESDGLKIAKELNKLNKYFTNIGTALANKIPNTGENDFRRHLLCMHCESSFSFNYTTPCDVSKLISKLKTKNSAGHGRMSTKLLQTN